MKGDNENNINILVTDLLVLEKLNIIHIVFEEKFVNFFSCAYYFM
jgi:hypothetical protein